MSESVRPWIRNWNLKKIFIVGGIGLLGLIAVLFLVNFLVVGNRVPANVKIAGVPIGGLNPQQAQAKLSDTLGSQYQGPITVETDGKSVEIDPAASGLEPDYVASVAQAGAGFSLNPFNVFRAFFGGSEHEMLVTVDETKLNEALEAKAEAFFSEPVSATVMYEDGEVKQTEAASGEKLDVEATAAAIVEAYPTVPREPVKATLTKADPLVTDAMAEKVATGYAKTAISDAVSIKLGEKSFSVTAKQIELVTSFLPKEGKLTAVLDAEELYELTADARKELGLAEAKNASYKKEGNSFTVVPAVPGVKMTPEELAKAVKEAAAKEAGKRTATAEVSKEEPEFSTEKAKELMPTEIIGDFDTTYPHSEYRNVNLARAAGSVNGTVLLPGETFSLSDTLGPRTYENGYVDGYVINNGILVKESGGGVSQSATTLFNAAFFAGLEDVEHQPHTLFFSRYPAGREATIYYGVIDLKFKNDTKYPIYIEGFVNKSSASSKGRITFNIWSNKTYDKVESTDLVKSDYYSGKVRKSTDPNCEPQAPIQGFTVTWKRLFYKDGKVVKEEPYKWTYSAGDQIVCE